MGINKRDGGEKRGIATILNNNLKVFISRVTNFMNANQMHFEGMQYKDQSTGEPNKQFFLFNIEFPRNFTNEEIGEKTEEFEEIINELYFQKDDLLKNRTINIFDDANYIEFDNETEFNEEYIDKLCNNEKNIELKDNVKPEPTLYIEIIGHNDQKFKQLEHLVNPSNKFMITSVDDKINKTFDRSEYKNFTTDDKRVLLYLHDIYEANSKESVKSY